jgi:hypothetical protein
VNIVETKTHFADAIFSQSVDAFGLVEHLRVLRCQLLRMVFIHMDEISAFSAFF